MTGAAVAPPGLVEQLGLFCQRWSRRRASYRPAGEIFDPRYVSVEPISEQKAKTFVLREHYSGSYPAARFRAGVLVKEPFRRERLAGVGVFSVPMNQKVVPAYFAGLHASDGVELGRFVLDATLASNAESFCLARMHRLLKAAIPQVRGVLAYCDPVERRDETGAVVKRGHVGTIYKATNATYRGTSSARTLWMSPSGASLADRLLSKARLSGPASAMHSSAWLRSAHRVACRTRPVRATLRGCSPSSGCSRCATQATSPSHGNSESQPPAGSFAIADREPDRHASLRVSH